MEQTWEVGGSLTSLWNNGKGARALRVFRGFICGIPVDAWGYPLQDFACGD